MSRTEKDDGGRKTPPLEDDSKQVMKFTKTQHHALKKNIIESMAKEAQAKEAYDKAKGVTKTAYNNYEKAGGSQFVAKFLIEKKGDYTDDEKQMINHALTEFENEQPYFNFNPTIQ